MILFELVLMSVGLAMDAFAMAVCKGMAIKKINFKKAFLIGAFFGLFQMMMPIIGYMLGSSFSHFVGAVDHWIAFVLLGIIGVNMIKESFSEDDECRDDRLSIKELIMLSIATSIDALAVGVSFAFLNVNIITSSIMIGIITCVISVIGVYLGKIAGSKLKNHAELLGGFVLIGLALKMIIEELL